MHRTALLFAAIAVFACAAGDKGSLHLRVIWPEGLSAASLGGDPHVRGRVEVRPGGELGAARIVSEAGPFPLGDGGGVELLFKELVYGPERVVVVEIVGSADPTAPVLLYGVSEPMSLELGKDEEVSLPVELRLAPGVSLQAGEGAAKKRVVLGVRVEIEHAEGSGERVPEARVELLVKAPNATLVTVANDPAFATETGTHALEDLAPVEDAEHTYRWPGSWDLNAGLPEDARSFDGARHVFVRVSNEEGIESPAAQAAAILDREPPALDVSLNGALFGAADTIRVTVNASEPLRDDPVVEVEGKGWQRSLEARERQGLSFAYEVAAAGLPEDGDYAVAVAATDAVGHPSRPDDSLVFVADQSAPSLSGVVSETDPEVRERSGGVVLATGGGQKLRVSCRVAEALELGPDSPRALLAAPVPVEIPRVALSEAEPGLWEASFELEITKTDHQDAEGTWPVRLVATDLAGNETLYAGDTAPRVRVDFTAPKVALASVGYAPAGDSPLPSVSAATAGTSIVFSLAADEALHAAAPVELSMSNGEARLVFTEDEEAATSTGNLFRLRVPEEDESGAKLEDGTYSATVRWTDLAGNEAEVAVLEPPIEVKTSTPVLSVDQERVLYVRSPWGNGAPEERGDFTIPAGPYFALAPADPLSDEASLAAEVFRLDEETPPELVRIWGSADGADLMAGISPNEDDSWPRAELTPLNVPAVYASGVDLAGNESERVLIENAEWVATPNPPATGTSPHRLEVTPQVRGNLEQDPLLVRPAGEGAEAMDDRWVSVRTEPYWRPLPLASEQPRARFLHAMAYDSMRGVTVMFGGRDASAFGETWEYDGEQWMERAPPSSFPS